jgi:hypothetical protein
MGRVSRHGVSRHSATALSRNNSDAKRAAGGCYCADALALPMVELRDLETVYYPDHEAD